MAPGGTRLGVASRATFRPSAATTSSGAEARFSSASASPESFWSVRSWSHFARASGFSRSSASRSTVTGAPCAFAGFTATERPVAVPRSKPIIVS